MTDNVLFSVWNKTREAWATSTNYSTRYEAEKLKRIIIKQCSDYYEVKERPFGTMKEGWQ